MDKVSIIIPCFNQANYLPDAIESALMQTYENKEIIVVNDGSTDNTAEVAAKYPVMVINQKNKGLSGARNAGITMASGEWILPLDADDMILPDYIEKTIGKADFITVDVQEFGDSDNLWRLGNDFSVGAFRVSNRAVCCSLYRKEIWKLIGGYDEDMRIGYEDWDFNLRCANAGFSMVRVPEALFLYRKHGRSMVDAATEKHDEIKKYIIGKLKNTDLSITYFLRDNGGCGLVRVTNPMVALRKHDKNIKVHRVEKGNSAEDIYDQLNKGDVFLIPRVTEENMLEIIKALQNEGKKVVIDYDDNMFNISPLSPHYEDHGTESVKYRLPDGKIVTLWEDGKNIDLKANRKKIDTVKKVIEQANMITVTTDILKDAYSQYSDNIQVLPNCLDLNIWNRLPLIKTDEIRICWFGGHSHYEDWCLLTDVLPAIMDKYKETKLVIMGAKFDGTLKKIPKDRIECHEWVEIHAYPYKSAILNPDIAIIPLRDTPFNRCKSAIKWLEMSALQVPSVTSFVSPYAEIATEDNGIFIENNDPQGWIDGISLLIEDSILRAKIGGAARRYVEDNFDINKRYVEWIEAYKGVLDGSTRLTYA